MPAPRSLESWSKLFEETAMEERERLFRFTEEIDRPIAGSRGEPAFETGQAVVLSWSA
jgi:hypothetical protein